MRSLTEALCAQRRQAGKEQRRGGGASGARRLEEQADGRRRRRCAVAWLRLRRRGIALLALGSRCRRSGVARSRVQCLVHLLEKELDERLERRKHCLASGVTAARRAEGISSHTHGERGEREPHTHEGPAGAAMSA